MDKLLQLQELMLKKNLVIRALPKELEYRYVYTGVPNYRKKEYDNILKTNPTAILETNRFGTQYINYKEKTKYQENSFILGISNNTLSCVDWIYSDKDKSLIIFNSLDEVLDYIKEN